MIGWWDKQVEPIPVLQWLVVAVLAIHILVSGQTVLGIAGLTLFVVSLLGLNVLLLHVLPRLLRLDSVVAILVIADSVLVPATLYASGTTRTDLFVVYFGIIMIAAASGSLKQALILTTITCLAYTSFTLWGVEESVPLEVLLLRLPFLLVMTLFYGTLGEYAQRERKDKEKLAYAALHDELTGMPNRRFIMETLSRELEEARRFDSPLSCAIMDIDYFKQVNDTFGHDVGDLMLKHYATLLASHSRGYDLAGRIGGDEYVWILPRVDMESAQAAGERFRETVAHFQFECAGAKVRVTTSIGMTTYIPGETAHPSPSLMLKSADVALYEAKNQGRNRLCHHPLLDPTATSV